jgi:AcrR family transcriptional regulator
MAQYKKSKIELKILKVAKKIFIKQGFQKSSLRDIAKGADITLSNLYNYYLNKDALFVAVLKPITNDFERVIEYGRNYRPEVQPFETMETKQEQVRLAIDYIDKHRNELHLLLNQSSGSSLANYGEYLAIQYENNWNTLFKHLKKKFPDRKLKMPSQFFIRNMAQFHLLTIGNILKHHYTCEEMVMIANEIAIFIWHGGMGLMNEREE